MEDHYARLLELRRSESAVRGLAKIPGDFYPTTQGYLEETRRTFESELRENPSSRRGEISRQTYQRASQAARDLIEARMSKLLAAAFQASVGGARELPNALREERELFERLVGSLTGFRRTAAAFLEPGAPGVPAETRGEVALTGQPPAPAASSPPGQGATRAAAPSPRVAYVHMLKDGRPIQVGRDTVDLRKDDVVALPSDTADLLVKGKLAEPIRPAGPGPVT